MRVNEIVQRVANEFGGVVPKSTWGETSLFYNPGSLLPSGVYFCTLKEKDGENDKASKLDREDVFRLSIGITKATYRSLFGDQPARPTKGGVIATGHDFTGLDELMPHPIYGWMSWVQILNPSQDSFVKIAPLLAEAHASALEKFDKKIAKNKALK